MPRMRATIEFEYDMPDDREQRVDRYGYADIDKCIEIDAGQDPIDFLECAIDVPVVTIVEAPRA